MKVLRYTVESILDIIKQNGYTQEQAENIFSQQNLSSYVDEEIDKEINEEICLDCDNYEIEHPTLDKVIVIKWNRISKVHPKDGQRVLVYDRCFHKVMLLCWNEKYTLWDEEDGDDLFSRDINRYYWWRPIPALDEI